MADIKVIEGDFTQCSGRYALVVGRFNGFVVESLVSGAIDTLRRHGIAESDITLVRVPGAYETPLAVKRVAETGGYDAIIALGAVIRGGTPHFEYVAGEAASGLGAGSRGKGVPSGGSGWLAPAGCHSRGFRGSVMVRSPSVIAAVSLFQVHA